MTQQDRQGPQQDERVLDYIYGELPPDERAAFEAQLGADAELRAELESLQRVHGAFQSLPKVQQSPESAQRMMALLMQQAAEHASAKPADKSRVETGAETGGGGKLLEMRPRGFRRFFQSPATGIFAAAAAALFWVVFKTQAPMPRSSSNPALEPAVTVASAPTEAAHAQPVEGALPKPVADNFGGSPDRAETAGSAGEGGPAKMEPAAPSTIVTGDTANTGTFAGKKGQAASLKDSFATALSKSAPAKPAAPPPATDPMYATRDGAKKAAGNLFEPYVASDKAKLEKPAEKKPVLLAQSEHESRKEGKADSLAGQRFAEAPPPKAADEAKGAGRGSDSLRAQMEQTQARRKDRIVEQLADQELGAMPSPVGGSARPSTPVPVQAPAEEPEAGRYAMNQAPASPPPPPPAATPAAADDAPMASSQHDYRSQNAAPAAAPPANYGNQASSGPRRAVSNSNIDGDATGSGLLATVQEQLRQGHCADANSNLVRLEQSFPATRGLAEARAQWQRSCQPQGQQAPNLQNLERQQLMVQPTEAPVNNLAPSQLNRSSMPSYKMAAPPRAAKRAAPAKPRPADAKAADAY